ncbi:MAG: hypothetical protein GF411_17770 [Candidatus Lokiarchaeota archaeon]|nr:hypothetical protein [Candidatus Lokiarchaeota archaeon]
MQATVSSINVFVGIIGFIFGIIIGYVIGSKKKFRLLNRLIYLFVFTMFAGVMAYILTYIFVSLGPYDLIIALLSAFGGSFFGVVINWAPTEKNTPNRRVIFDLEEDDELFEQQIRKLLDADT